MRTAPTCTLALSIAATALAGCASVTSIRVGDNHNADGLTYFLPKRDILISVTKAKEADTPLTISVEAATATPDFAHAYVASIPRSQLGNTKGSIQVNAQGLLNSESTSSIASTLTSLLQSAAGLHAVPFGVGSSPATDCKPGTYSQIVAIGQSPQPICGVTFTIDPVLQKAALPRQHAEPSQGKSEPGLFYRIGIPYVVTAMVPTGSDPRKFIVFSPSDSPSYFLPVARAAFGSNDASFTFDNGVPTKYGQTIQSEAVGFVGLPATLLQSYFKAVGEMFGSRKDASAAEKAYLDALNSLNAERAQRDACMRAVAAHDDAKIAAECK